MTRAEKKQLYKLLREQLRRKSKDDFTSFCGYTDDDLILTDFHKVYYKVLGLFAMGKIKKLMITIPAQHGKSEGSSRKIPAFIFGVDPNRKIAIGSYNATFARKFNKDVQRIIDDPVYSSVFPKTTLAGMVRGEGTTNSRNTDDFDIVGHKGYLRVLGRGGALTGLKVDLMIMDDLYKDSAEGNSPIIRESVWDWYTSVVKKRLHNDSQELIVFTRWHEDDLVGRIEKKEKVVELKSFDDLDYIDPETWVKINFQALKDGDPTEIDPREQGEALWPERHSAKKLVAERNLDPATFETMSQGNPTPKEGYLYGSFNTYEELPKKASVTRNYTDTADTGKDYLCSINYKVYQNKVYVTDVLHTPESMEITEDKTIDLIKAGDVRLARIESNNGGRGFARVIDKGTSSRVAIKWFHQSGNKESRIMTNSASVNQNVIFPSDWEYRWPMFYQHVTMFKREFKANSFDDAPDTLTGIIEMMDIDTVSMSVTRDNRLGL